MSSDELARAAAAGSLARPLIVPDKDNPVLTRKLVYTGLTRARESVRLLCNQVQLAAFDLICVIYTPTINFHYDRICHTRQFILPT